MREAGNVVRWCVAPAVAAVVMLSGGGHVAARGQRVPPRVTLYLPLDSSAARTVGLSLEEVLAGLAEDARFTRLAAVLEPVEPQLARLKQAAELVSKGRALVQNLEVRQGIEALRAAAQTQEELFFLVARAPDGIAEHARLLAELAVAYFLDGNTQDARVALQRAFVFQPATEYDATLFPAQMKRLFGDVQAQYAKAGRGELQVTARPVPAEIYVNGAFIGMTPVAARGLTPGRNLITAAAPGHQTRTTAVEVLGAQHEARLDVELAALPGRPAELLAQALRDVTAPRGGAALQRASDHFAVDVLLLAATRREGEAVHVQLYLYDARTRKVTGRITGTITTSDPAPGSKALISAIVPLLPDRPLPPPVVVAKPQGSWFARFRESQYFWPVVGTVAASVVGVSLGLGIYYGTHDDADRARRLLLFPVIP